VLALTAAVVLLRWSWEHGAEPDAAAGEGRDPPAGLALHSHTFDGPGLWGMGLTMLADAALYGSLIFAWLFLWTVAPGWQPPPDSPLAAWSLPGAAAAFAAGWLALRGAVRHLKRGEARGLAVQLWFATASGAAGSLMLVFELRGAPLQPMLAAHDAMLVFLLWFLLLHGALAAVLAVLQAVRVRRGLVGVHAPYEPGVVASLWSFVAGATLLAWFVFGLLPGAFGAGR
jgi:cytochrome c oxidase subunit I+III